ncbi:MAG: amylo-alpha-1,6-glucosidase [Ancalomicrobiaceae bacterium]|nr:amylo-alpha-1,6-glucosidase [Ancalomicrobiaceae bacterium]
MQRTGAALEPSSEIGQAGPQIVVPATASYQEKRPRTLKHNDTFAVFDHYGDAFSAAGSVEGLFHRDTRHLSHLLLTVDGARPILLSSTIRDDHATLTCDLTNPDIPERDGRPFLEHDMIHIRRSRFLYDGACFERLVVRNYDVVARRIGLTVSFSADFADVFEVRGTQRANRGATRPPQVTDNSVTLSYTGLDFRVRETLLRFAPEPTSLSADRSTFVLDLAPGEARILHVEIRCGIGAGEAAAVAGRAPDVDRAFATALRGSRQSLRGHAARSAKIVTSNKLFDEGLRRAVSDLHVLITDTPHGPFPYAGIPWFSTAFGRDALITAYETLWFDPEIARGVLCHLAAAQAVDFDAAADAEPGKILHEERFGEMAELGEVPFRRYYGSVDSTPLFLMLAGAYLDRTNDLTTLAALWPHIEAALAWIDRYGDRDGDGFVEYGRQTGEGLVNQGWKDSKDSVFHANGSLAVGPIALIEVQAYVYAGWRGVSQIAARLDRHELALDLQRKAEDLRQRFDATFFDEELGTYVLALDGAKRPCRVRSSNAGHALFAGIAYPERSAAVAASLMSVAGFSGWGVRTLAVGEPRYNPMSYHNGSVWPHDNALIALGLSRYGFRRESARIFEGLFTASVYFDLRRLPELFCGLARQRAQGPTAYPVACVPQAWAAAAPLALLQAALGLGFDLRSQRVCFDRPQLPAWLDDVSIAGITVGADTLDVSIRRVGEEAAVSVVRRDGPIGIQVTS